jgi:hypothetical protein
LGRFHVEASLKKIPKASYETPEQLDARIHAREAEAALSPPGPVRQAILVEVAQLKAYAEVQRWVTGAPSVVPARPITN